MISHSAVCITAYKNGHIRSPQKVNGKGSAKITYGKDTQIATMKMHQQQISLRFWIK